MESKISLYRCSSVASSHQPLLDSLQSWYTSQYRSLMGWQVESGLQPPWQWVPPLGLIQAMAPSGLSG